MTTPKPNYPLHRLNTAQTKSWLKFPNARPFVASTLAKQYRRGVGLLSATLRLFVIVDPRGQFRELPKPWAEFEMWQVDNAPAHYVECACRNYFDPEVQGPWKARGEQAGHHPFCQFNGTAVPVYQRCFESAVHRSEQGLDPQARPDEWFKAKIDAGVRRTAR